MSESLTILWNNFRTGDERAYTSLIKTFSNSMFKYGIRFVNDADFVKDCIQDVYFELWNRRERIRQTESVKSYLFKSLRLRIFREKSNWKYAESLEDNYSFIIEFDVESSIIQLEGNQELQKKLQCLLNNLPRRQKEILYLRFYEGLDQDRISEIMGLNKQSVYNLLHEAIIRLRKYWFKETYLIIFSLLEQRL